MSSSYIRKSPVRLSTVRGRLSRLREQFSRTTPDSQGACEPDPPPAHVGVPTLEDKDLVWIFGSGRSGSTWLAEMLSRLNNTRTWFEPYFGTLLQYPFAASADLEQNSSRFLAGAYRAVWAEGIRNLFLSVAEARYGALPPGCKFIIKDVNAPQVCPFFADIFPRSRYILLLRDPFDILDSQIDMQRPGSWNEAFAGKEAGQEPTPEHIRKTAGYIRDQIEPSLAGYESVAPDLRLRIRYREMLADPGGKLKECTEFLEVKATRQEITRAVETCDFKNHKETGQGKFRRFGKAGIWQTSGNFTPEVTQIATEVLGDLRVRLGYE